MQHAEGDDGGVEQRLEEQRVAGSSSKFAKPMKGLFFDRMFHLWRLSRSVSPIG